MSRKVQNRLFAEISKEIGGRIVAGHYLVGERLPSERLLAQEFAVSRPTIREALFALELAGQVEVRVGSGVYATGSTTAEPVRDSDMGPFEMLEARRAIEGEACAIAAIRITADELVNLEDLLEKIGMENDVDVIEAELADRRFHEAVAAATHNQAMAHAVEVLWEAREQSQECQLMGAKARAAGVVPSVEEHRAILDAIRSRDPAKARSAMHKHLTRVLDSVMAATEVEEIELARARVAAQRARFKGIA